MSNPVTALSDETFPDFIQSGPSLVMISSPTCGPCHTLKPLFDEAAGVNPDIKFGIIMPDTGLKTLRSMGINSVPRLYAYTDGQATSRYIIGTKDYAGQLNDSIAAARTGCDISNLDHFTAPRTP